MNCLLQGGRRLDGTLVDIDVRDGEIHRISPEGTGDVKAFAPERRFDAGYNLVTPTFTEPHIHLDTALTAGGPRWNSTGTLEEGISIWSARKDTLSDDDIEERARQAIDNLVVNGVTRARTHVDVTDPSLSALDVLVELRTELAHLIDLQIVAFPQEGLRTDETHEDLVWEAIDCGADVVGGIPHAEHTREDGVLSVRTAIDIATRTDSMVDLHIDETDDPQSRFTEVLAAEAMVHDIGAETTASHATAMHSYPDAYARKLISLLADSGIQVVTNPSANAVLQGREGYPRRRGHTRIDQLRDSEVVVGLGQDSLRDPWYHYGTGDPLDEAFVLMHLAHMNGREDVEVLWDMMLRANARIFGADESGLQVGNEGSLVVFDGETPFEVLRKRGRRRLVIKQGRRVASGTPGGSTVHSETDGRAVEF